MEEMGQWEIEHILSQVSANADVARECLIYFNKFPENKSWFEKELEELRWRNKYIGEYRNHISLTAVPLATKIYEQLGIITFPFIQRNTCRGWGTSGGTWAWSMQVVFKGNYQGDIGSGDPVKVCLQKNRYLSQCESGEICAELNKYTEVKKELK